MLQANSVVKLYETGTKALDGVSLSVESGQIYCLLGANGAGKSTLIYNFLDFIRPTSGQTFVNGVCVQDDPVQAKVHLAYLPDNVLLYSEMRAMENLEFFSRLSGQRFSKEKLLDLFDRVHLDRDRAFDRVGGYSKGMRQKLGLAILLARGAEAFLLDEPTTGLDPQSSRDLIEVLQALSSEGAAILMATHDIFRAHQIAHKVGILRSGRLVRELSEQELREIDLEATYLEYLADSSSPRDMLSRDSVES